MDYKDFFKGKKITLVGLGTLGRGVGDARFLAECGAELIVTDMKSADELAESIAQLSHLKNISFSLDGHKLEDFQGRDIVIKGAGVPLDSPFIKEAMSSGAIVTMSTALFAKLSDATIVGVTGTRGKSTVTHMIYEALLLANKDGNKKVFLGGNEKGVSTLSFLNDVRKGDMAVLELDSWQLQGFEYESISPHVSVFTNFMEDHQNYYKGDMKAYFRDKANIFLYQKEEDTLVLGETLAPDVIRDYENAIVSRVRVASVDKLPKNIYLKIPGEHNRQNAICALEALRALGVEDIVSIEALNTFRGVPGRLELVREYKGVKIYNDTNATTPDATLVGLKALSMLAELPNIVLIMGGADKNLDMSKLTTNLKRYCKSVVLLSGSGSDKLNIEKGVDFFKVSNLEGAIEKAISLSENGDIIIFSPAFASFGMFKNEYDRGEQFNAIVKKLT